MDGRRRRTRTLEVDSPIGRQSIADGMAFLSFDLFVHAWDVAAEAFLAWTGRSPRVDAPRAT